MFNYNLTPKKGSEQLFKERNFPLPIYPNQHLEKSRQQQQRSPASKAYQLSLLPLRIEIAGTIPSSQYLICGLTQATQTPVTRLQPAALWCASCSRFIKWWSQSRRGV